MIKPLQTLFAGQQVHDVTVLPGASQILVSYDAVQGEHAGNVALLELTGKTHTIKARTKTPRGSGSVLKVTWIAPQRRALLQNLLTQYLWVPPAKAFPVELVQQPVSTRAPLRAIADRTGTYLWVIEVDPSVRAPSSSPGEGSGLTASLQVVQGIPQGKRIALFAKQVDFPLEEWLVQVGDSGKRLYVIADTNVLRTYQPGADVKHVTIHVPPVPPFDETFNQEEQVILRANRMSPTKPRIIGFTTDQSEQRITVVTQTGAVCTGDNASRRIRTTTRLSGLWQRANLCRSRSGDNLLVGGETSRGTSLYLLSGSDLKTKVQFIVPLKNIRGLNFLTIDKQEYVAAWGMGGCFIYSIA